MADDGGENLKQFPLLNAIETGFQINLYEINLGPRAPEPHQPTYIQISANVGHSQFAKPPHKTVSERLESRVNVVDAKRRSTQ